MIEQFKNYIRINNLFRKTDSILLGISGGIDSIAMFHLFRLSGLKIGIAHCNFSLRGDESDKDEEFVRNLADNYNIPYYTKRFNTQTFALNEGISIQMAARDLRYEWFEEIRNANNYQSIAIAHNADDQIETFFINLIRGTGIKGLVGIRNKTGHIVRPLLFATRKDIVDFAGKNNFLYREDSSNSSLKYIRNKVRHEIIPAIEQLNPSFRKTMMDNIQRIKETEQIFNQVIENKYELVVSQKNQSVLLNIDELKKLDPVETYLHEFLKPYGFSVTQIQNIVSSFDNTAGKQFFSATHRILKDRTNLIVDEITVLTNQIFYINDVDTCLHYPINLTIKKEEINSTYSILKEPTIGQFDFDKLVFPLTLRKWQKGDYFMPLGMNNLKKLSDFFIDQKLSISEKENIWILESENKIVWIIGLRPDERFKITNDTKTILKMQLS
jgi:tRNA(Ile)-lysidine synthase